MLDHVWVCSPDMKLIYPEHQLALVLKLKTQIRSMQQCNIAEITQLLNNQPSLLSGIFIMRPLIGLGIMQGRGT